MPPSARSHRGAALFHLYYEGLVFGSPVTLSPGFHSPRFINRSTRSYRFNTFRFAPSFEAVFKLRCIDIARSLLSFRSISRPTDLTGRWPDVRSYHKITETQPFGRVLLPFRWYPEGHGRWGALSPARRDKKKWMDAFSDKLYPLRQIDPRPLPKLHPISRRHRQNGPSPSIVFIHRLDRPLYSQRLNFFLPSLQILYKER